MISEILINTIIQAATTGAALIFAVYGIIIACSDKLKQFKENKIREIKDNVDKKKTGSELKELGGELEEAEATPLYFTRIVLVIFLLYVIAIVLGLFYLNSLDMSTSNLGNATIISFGLATVLFGLIGLRVLNDILDFMKDFLIIKEAKNKKKVDDKNGKK
ncbi:hypothetical protein HYY69_03175 [Candidatus Woesearchaeota archaeon]|nr:hypothetical protein [Candidatus Woesearchaeota archaeon]